MTKNIFSYKNYKELLADLVAANPRGTKRRLAAHCKCQESYMSNVLNGSAHLNAEQIEAACRFFQMTDAECQYVLLLLQENRSGTPHLRNQFSKMLQRHRIEHDRLQESLEIKSSLSTEDQARYYSAWYYAAVHMLLLTKEFRKPEAIAARLNLSLSVVTDVLKFLVSIGAASKRLQEYFSCHKQLHLDRASPFIISHHRNWRVKAMTAIESIEDSTDVQNLHYSGVVTISHEDFIRVREILSIALKNSVDVIRDSKDETLASIGIDFFGI